MRHRPAHRALLDATFALLAALLGMAMFLPPLAPATLASVPRTVGAGLLIGLALPLHWVWLGSAARQMHRTVAGWVGLSVLMFPLGSAAALMVLGSLLAEAEADPTLAH